MSSTSTHRRRFKQITSQVKKLRGWVGSDASVGESLVDALNEVTALRLLDHSYADAAADAQDALTRANALVAEHGAVSLIVPLAGIGVECAGRELVHRKRQHVRRAVHAALLAVDGVDDGVVRERHVELARNGHALGPERCGGRALDIALRVRKAQAAARAGDGNLRLCHAFFLTVVLRAAGFLAAAAARFSFCLSSCS